MTSTEMVACFEAAGIHRTAITTEMIEAAALLTSENLKEYARGYRDGFAMRYPSHTYGEMPEPVYRSVAYPAYTDGHKAGRRDRMTAGKR
jgi:hypothetical protein